MPRPLSPPSSLEIVRAARGAPPCPRTVMQPHPAALDRGPATSATPVKSMRREQDIPNLHMAQEVGSDAGEETHDPLCRKHHAWPRRAVETLS